MTKNDKDGQTTENIYGKKTWNLEMSSICLALAKASFSQGLFSIRRRVIWAIWLVYMYMTFSMCPPVKINQKSSQDSAKWIQMEIHHPNVYLASWVCLLTCLFRRNISCVEFSFTWLSCFILVSFLVLGAIFEAMYWHSFPQRDSL